MTNNIRAILLPLFIVSYVTGVRIAEFSGSKSRPLLYRLYIFLFWAIYCFLLVYTIVPYVCIHANTYQITFWINISTAFLSVFLGWYYDKMFRRCLSKLAIVDDTFEKLGITTNHKKVYKLVLSSVIGLLIYTVWITCTNVIWHRHNNNNNLKSTYMAIMLKYPSYVNLIDDIIITSTLGYIGLKFDQINQYLRNMEDDNKFPVKWAWQRSTLLSQQDENPKSKNNEYIIWIIIHLHLELRKISRELNSIFGLQMTVKMGSYFCFIALAVCKILNNLILFKYTYGSTLTLILIVTFIVINIFRLFIINYMCEKVSIKANAIGDVICRIPCTTNDVVMHDNILQLILQVNLVPLRFYGLRLFQFGLKFFHGFAGSVTTVIVILLQANKNM